MSACTNGSKEWVDGVRRRLVAALRESEEIGACPLCNCDLGLYYRYTTRRGGRGVVRIWCGDCGYFHEQVIALPADLKWKPPPELDAPFKHEQLEPLRLAGKLPKRFL
jgi:hypothetical protein